MTISRLCDLSVGTIARVAAIKVQSEPEAGQSLDRANLEQRLLEFGFFEGESVEVLHKGPLGADPLCVRIGNGLVAIRRFDAECVQIQVS